MVKQKTQKRVEKTKITIKKKTTSKAKKAVPKKTAQKQTAKKKAVVKKHSIKRAEKAIMKKAIVKKKTPTTKKAATAKKPSPAKTAIKSTIVYEIRPTKAARKERVPIRPRAPAATEVAKKPKPDELEKILSQLSTSTEDVSPTEATKFDIGLKHDAVSRFEQELPSEYGKDRVVLLVVDPGFVFTYWEVRTESIHEAMRHIGSDGKLTLRFYDVSASLTPEMSNFWDIEVFDRLGNWYLKLSYPEQHLCLDIGLRNKAGLFYKIARSAFMRLPPQSLAKPGPIKWMVVSPDGNKIISDVEEYTDADLALLKKILGPYFFDLLMRGRLASIAGSSIEAIFYEIGQMRPGESPTSGPPWAQAR